jgi:dTDP-glucose 4,6-dehydratase
MEIQNSPSYTFVHGDICDYEFVQNVLKQHKPTTIVHFAAESHVDRSIDGPGAFLKTNIDGTFTMLQAARAFYSSLTEEEQGDFRFIHVSTDEVYGTLQAEDPPFRESNAYSPNSPYAASKAASDHLVRAWFHTYGLPTITTNCSNNYGRFQFPEKLIPLIYGDGQQIRDWLFVDDHCKAILRVLEKGRLGETYNIGGGNQRSNIEVVKTICTLLDELVPQSAFAPHAQLITYVQDRPGHDRRYAIDANKLESELNWRAEESFESGLRKTVQWYLDNPEWIENVTSGAYQEWIGRNYDGRTLVGARGTGK